MFNLFKKSAAAPEERLAACLAKKDYPGLARAYYDMGKAAMEAGDPGRAMLWLSRADTIYSARDELYEAAGEVLTEDCSERIGQLEEAPTYTNKLLAEIQDRAAELGEAQVRVWALFTLSRLARLGERLSALPGCGALGKLEGAVRTVLRSFQEPVSGQDLQDLLNLCGELYELESFAGFWNGEGELPVPGGAPFQVFDLDSQMVLLEIDSFLDSRVRSLTSPGDSGDPEPDLIPCALLSGYYLRTVGEDLSALPQIQAETARIWDDLAFLQTGPTWARVEERIQGYLALDILNG